MVARGHGTRPDRTLWEGVLYDARDNLEGLHLIEGTALDEVLVGIGVDQDVVISRTFAIVCANEALGDDPQQRF